MKFLNTFITFTRIAARNLIQARHRSLMLGSAITTVTVLLVLLQSVTAGVESNLFHVGAGLLTGHINIAGFYKIHQNSAAPVVTRTGELMKLAKQEFPEARQIIDRIKAFGTIISDTHSLTTAIYGIDIRQEGNILGRLQESAAGKLSDMEQPGSVVLFATQAKKLGVKPGDPVTVSMPTYHNISNTRDLRVAAVLEDQGMLSSFTTFMSKPDIRALYEMAEDATGEIEIFVDSPRQVAKIEERLREIIPKNGFRLMEKEALPFWMKFDRVAGESWTGQKIDITTWKDETAFVKWVLDLIQALTFTLTFVLLVIIVLGLMNTLWISIRERTSEIGTLRAIGLQRRQVILLFMIEAALLSTAATLAGVGIGVILAGIVNLVHIPVASEAVQMFLITHTLYLEAAPGDLLLTMIVIPFFLVLGALYPSYKASLLKPLTAMQTME